MKAFIAITVIAVFLYLFGVVMRASIELGDYRMQKKWFERDQKSDSSYAVESAAKHKEKMEQSVKNIRRSPLWPVDIAKAAKRALSEIVEITTKGAHIDR